MGEVKDLLASYDAFLAGGPMDSESLERFAAVSRAASFGAAAYERGYGDQSTHAMARSFLLALINPAHPDLDYLRADPKSGEVARLVAADLEVIALHTKEGGV